MTLKQILMISFISFTGVAFAENWILIGMTPDLEMTAYVDKDSVKKVGKFISASDKLITPKFDATMYSVQIYNCTERETQLQGVILKTGNGMIRDLGAPNPPTWAYKPVADNLPSKTFDYVCKK